jgi:predicted helicase
MNSFDEIHILNLHGNSLKKEKCPDGSKDVNVFDIQQGVAIALFIKKRGSKKNISYAEQWGERENKYSWLDSHDVYSTGWNPINPKSDFYLFIPRDESLFAAYEKFPRIIDILKVNSVGIVSSRDKFVIDINKDKLRSRILQYRNKNLPDEIIEQTFKLRDKIDKKKLSPGKGKQEEKKLTWSLKESREKVMNDNDWEKAFTEILYRPFDKRHIYFHSAVIERSREAVMRHMAHQNAGIILPKRVETKIPWTHVLYTQDIVDHVIVSEKTIDYLFPLYLYTSGTKKGLFHAEEETREPNIKPKVFESLSKVYRQDTSPEDIFYYIYAVLYSEIYRKKYAEFLKLDFPRIPLTKDYELFKRMAGYGNMLADLHLLKSPALDSPIAQFQGQGGKRVGKPKCDDKTGRVFINKEQYFEGVSEEVWTYQIGGYQVCDKWLKDRKKRILSLDEIQTYCRIVTAIQKTIEIQKAIDDDYQAVERDII